MEIHGRFEGVEPFVELLLHGRPDILKAEGTKARWRHGG